ncbi:type I polyketide synthase [Corynebacterium lubricantis]|uniref:type I polyketide synthase n=1 Tax=Corynebacterium lubricantis TaxID=541095 RepID=UPI0003684D40|nr:type I polyketide synthase [Corynebacterium lubricantis]
MTDAKTNPGQVRLNEKLGTGPGKEPFAMSFSGQGFDWLPTLNTALTAGVGSALNALVEKSRELLSPLGDELAAYRPFGFDPVAWAESETNHAFDASDAAVSVPGVLVSQLAVVESLKRQGLLIDERSTAIGHSQGILGVAALENDPAEILAIAELIGVAITRGGRLEGLVRSVDAAPMVSIGNITREQLDQALAGTDLAVALCNGRTNFVVSGNPEQLDVVVKRLEAASAKDKKAVENKRRGGLPFNPTFAPLNIQVAFHHPALEPAVDQVEAWAKTAGLNTELARELAHKVMVAPVDWLAETRDLADQGVQWVLEVGPTKGVASLTKANVAGLGIGVLPVADAEGQSRLFDYGMAPVAPRAYSEFAPQVIQRGGKNRLQTRFTEVTGRSPILLAGMTPSTVDPEIVAAAANAGFWAELAGGGQVTEEVLEDNLARLTELLEPGVNAQFNSMFLNPQQWRMQIEGKRMVPRARRNGTPIDGVVVSAGIPPHDDAVALVENLRESGIPWVAFKPGAVAQISKILKIADDLADTPILMQLEGGKAGGHHSWEDLDELLISAYDDIRSRQNVVLIVGGGVGTPQGAADYLSGQWSLKHGLPAMPVDGILVGTAAMATKESTASESVKQLLAETSSIEGWVGKGEGRDGMASAISQLGADLYEIDNSWARTGRLIDEVNGDAEAAEARRDEIIAALATTCRPYFGATAEMSYEQWLRRYAELSAPNGTGWVDITWYTRFADMLERAEARLNEQDHGEFTPVVEPTFEADPSTLIDELVAAYPQATTQKLHPADTDWFVALCRRPGKPVGFVPAIDADLRRSYRTDSLWQAHDERYDADAVCIIPGIVAVDGIERANEPVAELLGRFEQAGVEAIDTTPLRDEATASERILRAPGLNWAGLEQTSLITRLGDAEYTLEDIDADTAALTVNVGQTDLTIKIQAPSDPAFSPKVTQADAEQAMLELTRVAAGGELAPVSDGIATWTASLSTIDRADYDNVTAGYLPAATGGAPDVLVGKAWPAVFAAVADAKIPGTEDLAVEGMLSLVHLEHHLTMLAPLPDEDTELTVTAHTDEVADTGLGRVVVVRAEIFADGAELATLSERFAIRGRAGKATATTNSSALPSIIDTPHSHRGYAQVMTPQSMLPFAVVSGDRNPIHVSDNAARLAGLPNGVIVHGMWTSAIAQLMAVDAGGEIIEYTATMLATILPGSEISIDVERTGIDDRVGRGEVRTVSVTADGELAVKATAVLREPRTFYGFPGQGIQSQGMGMDSYASSPAARAVWDRADQHTRAKLGFSILEIVRNNPAEVVVDGEAFHHPDGALFLTQFTQVAMATLGCAQIAEMREAHVLNEDAFFAGHSVGEYNALAAYAEVLSLEAVVEIVYRRGLTMHRLVERDEDGNSNYALAALRPYKMGLASADVESYVEQLSKATGEFLEIVNYNIDGRQYAVAGTLAGLKALGADAEQRGPGQRALVMIPGIDVPFHSSKLLGGVDDFRAHLDSLIPADVDLQSLEGRYIPNLVARPFELTRDFVESIAEVVESSYIEAILKDFDKAATDHVALGRMLLIELLAWQFASPVRWIETQELILTDLDIESFVEVGVGASPTLANMLGQTLALPKFAGAQIEVNNLERDRARVFATDEIVREVPEVEEAEAPAAAAPAAPEAAEQSPNPAPTEVPAAPAATGGARPADIPFTPADATEMLVSVWTKVRPDQMGATDSIETLVEGVSSRRNQLLLDLGVEFGLGAIDGAADAELNDLKVTVTKMAKGYQAFGPVLGDSVADSLRRITGPTGKKPGYVAERVTGVWQLGQGWADHVTAAVVMGTREGASLRGGDLATLPSATSAAELDALIDAAVQAVAQDQGVAVALPSSGGGAGGVVDSEALGEFAEQVTGESGVLAETARELLRRLGHEHTTPETFEEADEDILDLVTRELGSDWPRQVAPSFDANQAVLLDDRWASAREDLARGLDVDVTGLGEDVAVMAEFLGKSVQAAQARDESPLAYAGDVAVVTGASPNGIGAAVTGGLLAGGATVIVTSSHLGHDRLEFYKKLYREHARGTAKLWVVPANLSAMNDLDALVEWIGTEQTTTVGADKKVTKPALVPTLLFPFAAPRVSGTLADAGPAAEAQMRLLLWSVERLIAGLSALGADTHVGNRVHIVLPGSPNRGRFGGDGAYGEAKAALDAVVTRWHAEPVWGKRTSIVHALIGWVRGTGLMGGNDPLVDAVEAKGVRTYSTEEISELLLGQISPEIRADAANGPVVADFTGGLGQADVNLPELAREVAAAPVVDKQEAEAPRTVKALPTPYQRIEWTKPDFDVNQSIDDMVVIVGAAEVGPYGSSRTRFDAELTGDLTAAGVIELAWSMGLIRYENGQWEDTAGNELDEAEIFDTYHDEVLGRVGVRRYHDDFHMVDNLAPELTTIYLEHDMTFTVDDRETAKTFVDSDPEHTTATFDGAEWSVTRKAGTPVRVPRRVTMSRFVGGQIPEDFDPALWGLPADMIDNLDRVAQWNLVATVDAFLSSGFSPAELLGSVHPARVSSTMGTGMGGVESLRSLYVDGILAEPRPNDILQESLPNVVAAHVMQDYVGGYGQMIHPVAACATAAVSVEEGMDKLRLGKADVVVTGGIDDLSIEGITGFGDMAATADSAAMEAKGIEHRYFSRANDRRRGGFIESEGGGVLILARGRVAYEMGLPVLGVVGFAESFADGAHVSIPAPGLGALSAARGGMDSRLALALRDLDVSADEIAIVSKHDTSTNANDPNESDLHERIARSLGRAEGNPLYVISQKSLTGHAKGGAAAFQLVGLTQVLRSGLVPANRALDCVDPALKKDAHMVWLREPIEMEAKAGLVTSLGFGHVSALVAVVHPGAFLSALRNAGLDADGWYARAAAREEAGLARINDAIHGGAPLYERPADRNLGHGGKELEAAVLLDDSARLVNGVLRTGETSSES